MFVAVKGTDIKEVNFTGWKDYGVPSMTAYQCEPSSQNLLWLLFIIPLVLLLITVTYCLCCRRVSKFYRLFKSVNKHRVGRGILVGKADNDPVSVVVTDIEGYSGGWVSGRLGF